MLMLRILIIIALTVAVAEADIYRYVDENGVVCYTDVPVNKSDKVMKSRSTSSPSSSSIRGTSFRRNYQAIVSEKAGKYELDPSLVHAVIKTESNGNPYAISRKGAKGLMQLMPGTANDLQVRNVFDPEENIDGGTRYLRHLIDRFNGDLTLALAAYNAGPKTVEKSWSIPHIPETRDYVRKVMALYNGKSTYPVSAQPHISPKSEPIYKVVAEDGTVLFTNFPSNRQYSRL